MLADDPSLFDESERDVEAAARVLSARPTEAMSWHRLGLALALAGRTGEWLAFCDRAAAPFGDAVVFAHNVVMDLFRRGAHGVVRRLAGEIPPQRREWALALYYAGCTHVAAAEYVAALNWFSRFQQAVLPRANAYPLADAAFNLIFRQGVLVDRPEGVRALAALPAPAVPPVTFLGPGTDALPQSDVVAVHVLDVRYFHRFANELCAGHRAVGLAAPLHFHVAAANSAVVAEMEALRAAYPDLHLAFSIEPSGRWDGPVYYTCARFMVMERLLDHYRRTVVTSDADIMPLLPLDRIASAAHAAEADFACFETGRQEPASVYQASIMVFPDRPRTRALVADLSRYCAQRLDLPRGLSWMLDQAALYSLLTQRGVDDAGFRFCALDRALGQDLYGVTRQLSNDAEKLAIMSGAPPQA